MNSFVTHTSAQYATTYYVRDPQGNALAVYERKRGEMGQGTLTFTEQHLYGAGRIGMRKRNLALGGGAEEPVAPSTHYALTNHLGNVMAVISDAPSDGAQPTVESLTDYYPFGMEMDGRKYSKLTADGGYRYGFTGHEKEFDMANDVYTTDYRLLDTRIGRWLSVDPLFEKYVGMSPYNYCAGNPVKLVDTDEREFTEEAEVKTDEEEAHARGALFRAGSASVDLKMYPNVKTKEMHINKHIQEQINYFNKNNPDKPIYQNEIYRVP